MIKSVLVEMQDFELVVVSRNVRSGEFIIINNGRIIVLNLTNLVLCLTVHLLTLTVVIFRLVLTKSGDPRGRR